MYPRKIHPQKKNPPKNSTLALHLFFAIWLDAANISWICTLGLGHVTTEQLPTWRVQWKKQRKYREWNPQNKRQKCKKKGRMAVAVNSQEYITLSMIKTITKKKLWYRNLRLFPFFWLVAGKNNCLTPLTCHRMFINLERYDSSLPRGDPTAVETSCSQWCSAWDAGISVDGCKVWSNFCGV